MYSNSALDIHNKGSIPLTPYATSPMSKKKTLIISTISSNGQFKIKYSTAIYFSSFHFYNINKEFMKEKASTKITKAIIVQELISTFKTLRPPTYQRKVSF